MTTTLFIKANNRPADTSVSVKLYDAFLKNYRESHPGETIIEVDLYDEHLPYLDTHMISANFKSSRGKALTPKEKTVTDIASKHFEKFLAADKIAIGFPLWNLSAPAVLHTFFDYMHRPGETFKYTAEGRQVGLLSDKKVALLNARGGVYSEGDAASSEMAVNFVKNHLNFFGITDVTTVIIEAIINFPIGGKPLLKMEFKEQCRLQKHFK